MPKYAGWCAYAMSREDEVSVNPEACVIQNDSLYLFYKTRFTNTVTKWQKTPKFFQKKADINCNKLTIFFNLNLVYDFKQTMEQF